MDDWKIKIGLSIGFVLFSFGNDSAIIRSQKILVAAANYLDQECIADDLALNQFLKSHTALSVTTMHLTHFVFSLCVLLAMWLPNIEKLLFRQNMVKTGTVPSDESTR